MKDAIQNELHARLLTGGFLLLPNHTEGETAATLRALAPGSPVSVILSAGVRTAPGIEENTLTRILSAETPMATAGLVEQEAAQGRIVLPVYPEYTRRAATTLAVPGSMYSAFLTAATPVHPIHLDLSAEATLGLHSKAHVASPRLSSAIPAGPLNDRLSLCQQFWMEASADCYAARKEFQASLPREILAGLKAHRKRVVVDGMDGSVTGFDKVLAAAMTLAPLIRERTAKNHVGLVLPAGRAAVIANIAVLFSGKIPVNLNFTAGRAAVESSFRQAAVDLTITADKVVRSLQDFPWPPTREMLLLDQVMPGLASAAKKQYLWSRILPAGWLARRLKLPETGGDLPGALLFTSGSSGEPKGVTLTQRNLLSNIAQFSSRLGLTSGEDKILSSLPFFHSFGITVGLLFPILEGFDMVTYPRPSDTVKLGELISKHALSLLVTTPTFLRGFLRRVNAEQLLPLKLLVTGAEKLPSSLADQFEARFGKKVMEGYGLTETSPVTNTNLPDLTPAGDKPLLVSSRPGSVGQLMPGLAIKFTHMETEEPRPLHEGGVVHFKGSNVFHGYLNKESLNQEILHDGWFRTGDLGRVDEDGFLFIDGRISRFSKIGGEMVPHETVEERILQAAGWQGDDVRRIAIASLPDDQKGEALVLLCTEAMPQGADVFLLQLRMTLLEQGVPSLWIPKSVVKVEEIPVLASGKLDLAACKALAEKSTSQPGSASA